MTNSMDGCFKSSFNTDTMWPWGVFIANIAADGMAANHREVLLTANGRYDHLPVACCKKKKMSNMACSVGSQSIICL